MLFIFLKIFELLITTKSDMKRQKATFTGKT